MPDLPSLSAATTVLSIMLPVERDHPVLDEIVEFAMKRGQDWRIDVLAASETASIPGAWRCVVCGEWIELDYPKSWPDHCGQRAEWVTSTARMKGRA